LIVWNSKKNTAGFAQHPNKFYLSKKLFDFFSSEQAAPISGIHDCYKKYVKTLCYELISILPIWYEIFSAINDVIN
jgi:hypothetical protein